MDHRLRGYASIVVAVILLALLAWRTLLTPPAATALLPALLFCLLAAFTTIFGVLLAAGRMSLLSMTAVAAYRVLGLVPAGWAAMGGALFPEIVRYRCGECLEMRREAESEEGEGSAFVIRIPTP